MAYEGYTCLKMRHSRNVLFVTIDNPPINLLDRVLLKEIARLSKEIEIDPEVKVVVFDSANPDFFIAHVDVNLGLHESVRVAPNPGSLGSFQKIFAGFRTMPKVSIAKIEGRTRGGGSEFVLSLDMRFGALGRAILSQPELGLSTIPGAGGTQWLPRLVGRSRALEIILSCEDFPADLAERYGYINRALPPEELTPFVEKLAFRIASFEGEAIALAKAAVNAAELPLQNGLIQEAQYLEQALAKGQSLDRMRKFLELGGQTLEKELDLGSLLEQLG
ncbi:enoyl-CoA hydratase-related protein [Thermodesulfobacteriota bacterium]